MRLMAFLAALITSASVLLTGTPASAGTLQQSGWQEAKSAPADLVGGGDALSCVTANWCISVGRGGTQIWDGQQWSSASTGKLDFTITAVSCYSRWDCMLVGYKNVNAGAIYTVPVVLHWDSVSWNALSPAPTVELPGESAFWGVSCPAAKTCIITGALNQRELLWQNGTWTSLPLPMPAGADEVGLGSVDCPAVNNCHAMGSVHMAGQPYYTSSQVMGTWDGTAWTIDFLPTDAYGGPHVGSISCPTTTYCVAVGENDRGLISEAWDGATWTESWIPDSPNKGDQAEQTIDGYQVLTGLSCWAVGRCQVIGNTNTASFHRIFNGTTWYALANPTDVDLTADTIGSQSPENGIVCLYASFCLTAGSPMERYYP